MVFGNSDGESELLWCARGNNNCHISKLSADTCCMLTIWQDQEQRVAVVSEHMKN